jgi:hypothetical protein
MRRVNPEKEVNVKKSDLLEKLEVNREQHVANYKNALVEYGKAVKEIAKAVHVFADKEDTKRFAEALIDLNRLQQPQNYGDEYDEAIAMLRMEIREELTIPASEFRCFVLDKWDFSGQLMEAMAFNSSSRAKYAG